MNAGVVRGSREEQWRVGRLRTDTRSGVRFAWFFALAVGLLSAPSAVIGIPEKIARGDWGDAAVLAVFPVLSLFLLGWAVSRTLAHRRWGESELELVTRPGVVGGPVEGVLHASASLERFETLHVTLACIRRQVRRSSRGRSQTERVLWQSETAIPAGEVGRDVRGRTARIRFLVPGDALPTDHSDEADSIHWRLVARASVPGIDYEAGFEVPVLRTAETDPGLRVENRTPARPSDPDGIRIDEGPRFRLRVPPFRHRTAALQAFVFAILVLGGAAFVASHDVPVLPWVLVALAALAGAVGVHWLLVRTRLEIDGDRVRLETSWIGLGTVCEIDRSRLKEVRVGVGAHMTSDFFRSTVYYRLELVFDDDTVLPTAEITTRHDVATWAAARTARGI